MTSEPGPRDLRIVRVDTDLGLRPGGVRRLGAALLDLGLADRLAAPVVAHLAAPEFDPALDPIWGVPNIAAIADLAVAQADAVGRVLDDGGFPVVLGGDDSVMFGNLVAMRRRGDVGLLFVDGHVDMYPMPDSDGEVSDSDLLIATGDGPPALQDCDGLGPYVRHRDVVAYGHRDRADQLAKGSRDPYATPMLVRSLAEVRAAGSIDAGRHAAAWLSHLGRGRVWLHLDADCLHDGLMPAVDWRLPDGLLPREVVDLVAPAMAAGLIAGMDVSIYNPSLDTADLAAGQVLADLVVALLTTG